ncbi:MAG TPA: 50S ribosomal protein L9 [Verrucomicrobiae bacterium]|jgi:large subunit ribosomal protein L9|nr:50S ribosomal protein L9 [Verrucomicrobiae bacterium]
MAKTEVILIQNIVGLGGESDLVKVAAGYARNYLYPQGLAVPVTSANKKRLDALKKRRGEREAHEFNAMSELAKSISKLIAVLAVKTGDDGKMFGAVTAGMIADQLKTQFDIALDKRKIHLEHPIKTLGEHAVELRLHHDVTSTLKVRIESTNPTAAAAPAPVEAKEERRTESRGHKRAHEEQAAPEAAAEAKPERKARKSDKAEKAESSEKPAKSKREKAEA